MSYHWLYLAFGALFLKHFVVDFLLQPAWMFQNKHRFGHPGGLAHSLFHGVVTSVILYWFYRHGMIGANTLPTMWVWLGVMEFPVHYMIDWLKMNLSIWCKWAPATHMQFWYALGADQLLHYLTYLAILMVWFG
jgi:Protein of unknown function (DUF3307)